MGGAGAYVWEAGGVVDALGEGHEFEGNEPLVVIEGKDAVELIELRASEKAIAGEGAIGEDAFGLHLVDDGTDDLLVEVADDAIIAGMRVEGQHGNLGTSDAEVALEALIHQHHLVEEQVVGKRAGHILQRIVVGHDADADAVADHHHKARGAKLMREILGVTREVEIWSLDVALVDGGSDQHIHLAGLEVGASTVEALTTEAAGHVGAFAEVNFHLLGSEVDEVELTILCLGGVADGGELHLLRHRGEELLMVGGHLGGAIDDGGTEVEHTAVAEGLEDYFVAHTVDVTVSDGHFYFLFFVHSFSFLYSLTLL